MKRLGSLWPQVIAFDNLLDAYRKARRGKHDRIEVARFGLNLKRELLGLHRDLARCEYQPGSYRLFTLYERKPRLIAAAPFRDRVVHHALMNVIEPPLDRSFIFDSYACRKGKGVHAAVERYQRWSQRFAYTLKMDVAQYFPSIDHGILKQKLRRRIKDPNVLQLLDLSIDASPQSLQTPDYFPGDDLLTPLERRVGIPIGNLTSQFFANLYLDDLDHHLKQDLRVQAYLRYVDDMIVLGDDKGWLTELRHRVHEQLNRVRLQLHPRKAEISRVADGLDVFGYLVFPHHRRLRNDNGYRFARRLRAFARAYGRGEIGWDTFNPSVQSWTGHACHGDTLGLRAKIFSDTVFTRGSGQEASGACCAAAAGTTNRSSCGRPTATGTNQITETTISVSVSPSPPAFGPEPPCLRTGRARPAGVHEPGSRPPREGSAK